MMSRKIITTLFVFIFVCDDREKVLTSPVEASSDVKQFENQIAGHAGILRDSDGFLLKYIKYPKELDFFEILLNTSDPELLELKQFVPAYKGTKIINDEGKNEGIPYMRLEDLTKGIASPSVMDIKMGRQIWEPTFSQEKIDLAKSRYTEMRETYEFSIQGFQYYNIANGELVKHGINYQMKIEEGLEYIFNFVNGKIGVESGLVKEILKQLENIYSWFQRQMQYHFYSCSVLMVYDSQALGKGEKLDVRVRLIDFAHVLRNTARIKNDENFIGGLEKLIAIFRNFLPEESSRDGLPDNLKPVDIQLADLVPIKKGSKLGVLRDVEGHLLKPSPSSGEMFFHYILKTVRDPTLEELKQYVLSSFGTEVFKINEEVITFLKLEDITKEFQLPCSLHVKLALTRRPPCVPMETAVQQLKYVATKKKWGFGIPGFAYHNATDGNFVQQGTELGYRMVPREAIQSVYNFMNGEIGVECGLVNGIVEELRKILSWFKRQKHFHFYDSSILITYDVKNLVTALSKVEESKKNSLGGETKSICENLQMPVKIGMFNFDKVFPIQEDEADENYLSSLQNLISIFENLPKLYADTLQYRPNYPTPLA